MQDLKALAKLIRHFILTSTTAAGSGHPSSSLSATELMTALFFGGVFRADLKDPAYPGNDRLIFSKGHASPLFYALYAAAGAFPAEELDTLRKFGSRLEGHPTLVFPYTEAPTGSLGQGIGIGVGMALSAKYVDKTPSRVYVLLGDSEVAEGSVWEAMQSAAHYKLDNLVAVLDVNRLGQRGETMYGHDLDPYEKMAQAVGWETAAIDGHDLSAVEKAFAESQKPREKPFIIIARTMKGKGISTLENADNWHGKPLSKDELPAALAELGEVDLTLRGQLLPPPQVNIPKAVSQPAKAPEYDPAKKYATRRAYGNALVRIFPEFPDMVVLDAETSNSTFAETFKKTFPDRFFEMYIAEQNMLSVALGFSRRGKIPFVSTFAAFLSRAFDQIRMSQYADANIKVVGSHAGVSIGEDGASQMGLEDIAMFRTLLGSTVLYPSDAISADRLVEEAARLHGNVYLRMTRKDLPLLYKPDEKFPVGGSKTLRQSEKDKATVIAAGITLHEALAAADELAKEGIPLRVIDLYSVKPFDEAAVRKAATETGHVIVAEDHFAAGGIGEAVAAALVGAPVRFTHLAVRQMPKSGKPEELLDYEEIGKAAIMKAVKSNL